MEHVSLVNSVVMSSFYSYQVKAETVTYPDGLAPMLMKMSHMRRRYFRYIFAPSVIPRPYKGVSLCTRLLDNIFLDAFTFLFSESPANSSSNHFVELSSRCAEMTSI